MIDLYNADAFEAMDILIDKGIKVDCIVVDPPYGTTKNEWDNIIPLDKMWEYINKIKKDNAIIVIFSDGLFTSKLKLSNEKNWRYDLVWDKVSTSGFLNANKMPLRTHENISIFYDKVGTYNPQKTLGKPNNSKGRPKVPKTNNTYGDMKHIDNAHNSNMKHPKSILRFERPNKVNSVHPTQKPLKLMEFIIKTYSNEGDIILDFTMGSGTTIVAAKKTNRSAIGIEIDEKFYNIAKDRVSEISVDSDNDILDEF